MEVEIRQVTALCDELNIRMKSREKAGQRGSHLDDYGLGAPREDWQKARALDSVPQSLFATDQEGFTAEVLRTVPARRAKGARRRLVRQVPTPFVERPASLEIAAVE